MQHMLAVAETFASDAHKILGCSIAALTSPQNRHSALSRFPYKSGWERSQLTASVPEVHPLSDFEYVPGFPQKDY
jgi:hypothetical protein